MLENPISRTYVRTNNWSVTAKTSKDKDSYQWSEAQVLDLAAGGLLFLTKMPYEVGDEIWFDLLIDPMTPGFHGTIPMQVKGKIKGDRGTKENMRAFSVAFTEITQSDRIRLDEMVRMTTQKYKVDAETNIYDR